MKVRYFEKRPGAWHLDFRGPDGTRLRPYGGTTEAEAQRNAPTVIAKALAPKEQAAASPQAAAFANTSQLRDSPTMEGAFRLALKVREQWIKAKAKTTLEQTFDSIVDGNPRKLTRNSPVALLTRDFVRDLRALWIKEPGRRVSTTLSASTINHRLSMCSVLLEVCDLPPHGVKHLSTKGNARHRRIPPAEFARMQEWAGEQVLVGRSGAEEFARLLPAGLDTGARLSELLDLPPKDVAARSVTFRDTKNGLDRTLPLRPAAHKALLAGTGRRPFPTLTADRVTQLWALMRRSMELEDDHKFVFHLLRHECASRFADEGKGAHFIKAWLGHENIATSESYVNMSLGGMAAQVGLDFSETVPLLSLS
jgi:integrase